MKNISEVLRLHALYLTGDSSGVRADLSSADLSSANLRGAILNGANLSGADLGNIKTAPLFLAQCSIVPQNGAFEGFKRLAGDLIAHVRIPKDARRIGGITGRKCRAEFVDVLGLYSTKYEPSHLEEGRSTYNPDFVYRVGERAIPDKYDPDVRIECAQGIHFFLTFEEAASY